MKVLGRPLLTGSYATRKELVAAVRQYRSKGLYDRDIAHEVGVKKSTVFNLRKKYDIA
jgi:transposase-like protein